MAHRHLFIYKLSTVAFALETMYSALVKKFTIWPFTEKVFWSVPRLALYLPFFKSALKGYSPPSPVVASGTALLTLVPWVDSHRSPGIPTKQVPLTLGVGGSSTPCPIACEQQTCELESNVSHQRTGALRRLNGFPQRNSVPALQGSVTTIVTPKCHPTASWLHYHTPPAWCQSRWKEGRGMGLGPVLPVTC